MSRDELTSLRLLARKWRTHALRLRSSADLAAAELRTGDALDESEPASVRAVRDAALTYEACALEVEAVVVGADKVDFPPKPSVSIPISRQTLGGLPDAQLISLLVGAMGDSPGRDRIPSMTSLDDSEWVAIVYYECGRRGWSIGFGWMSMSHGHGHMWISKASWCGPGGKTGLLQDDPTETVKSRTIQWEPNEFNVLKTRKEREAVICFLLAHFGLWDKEPQ